MVHINKVAPGAKVLFYTKQCIVLEHRPNGTLLLACDQVKEEYGPFNNFKNSHLRHYLNRVYPFQELDCCDVLVDREVDLTAQNGSTQYGTVFCKVAPLTIEEMRKFRDLIPMAESLELTVTPCGTYDDDEGPFYLVTSDHFDDDGRCTCPSGVRPAFLVHSDCEVTVLVGDEPDLSTGEVMDDLFYYTTEALLAELTNRFPGKADAEALLAELATKL